MKTLRLCTILIAMLWALPALAQIDPELLKAAERGDSEAQFGLALMYAKGQGGASQDYFKAFEWLRKAAEQGHAKAQYAMGNCYDWGYGTTRDYTKAAYWYQKAAEQGDSDAQNALGLYYFYRIDQQKGCSLVRASAEQGNIVAVENYKKIGCAK